MLMGDIKKYESVFSGWSEKEIHLVNQMVKFLRRVNLTFDDLEKYADFLERQRFLITKAGQKIWALLFDYIQKNMKKCPECGEVMNLQDVNISKCTQVPQKKYRSVWTCSDEEECGYQVWNPKPAFVYMQKLQRQYFKQFDNMTIEELAEMEIDHTKIEYLKNVVPASGGCCGGKKEKENG